MNKIKAIKEIEKICNKVINIITKYFQKISQKFFTIVRYYRFKKRSSSYDKNFCWTRN